MKYLLLTLALLSSQVGWAALCNPAVSKHVPGHYTEKVIYGHAFSVLINKDESLSFQDAEELAQLICDEMSRLGELKGECSYKLRQAGSVKRLFGAAPHSYIVTGLYNQEADGSSESIKLEEAIHVTLADIASEYPAIADYRVQTDGISRKIVYVAERYAQHCRP